MLQPLDDELLLEDDELELLELEEELLLDEELDESHEIGVNVALTSGRSPTDAVATTNVSVPPSHVTSSSPT